jgi:hypothetical protein
VPSPPLPADPTTSLFVWLVADCWCWFVLKEKYCWLVVGGWCVVREKYYWLVADKTSEQAAARSPPLLCDRLHLAALPRPKIWRALPLSFSLSSPNRAPTTLCVTFTHWMRLYSMPRISVVPVTWIFFARDWFV